MLAGSKVRSSSEGSFAPAASMDRRPFFVRRPVASAVAPAADSVTRLFADGVSENPATGKRRKLELSFLSRCALTCAVPMPSPMRKMRLRGVSCAKAVHESTRNTEAETMRILGFMRIGVSGKDGSSRSISILRGKTK